MPWLEVKFKTEAKLADTLSSLLEVNGALAVTLQDAGNQPIYEPDPDTPVWDHVFVIGLFDQSQDIDPIMTRILTELPTLTYETNELADEQWERTWMQDFAPMQFGKKLWIIPSYLQERANASHIILDPGLAFGTGKHPTTALCLRWLDSHIHEQVGVIDYGCGSGILAIAAIKLGAKCVYAVDHDPQAISATIENAERNNITQNLIASLSEEFFLEQKADLLIANILAKPLIDLREKFASLIKPDGQIVLSGILNTQIEDILMHYQPQFEIIHIEQQEEWARIDGIRK